VDRSQTFVVDFEGVPERSWIRGIGRKPDVSSVRLVTLPTSVFNPLFYSLTANFTREDETYLQNGPASGGRTWSPTTDSPEDEKGHDGDVDGHADDAFLD
jgi:hypothetical protein